MKKTKYVTQTTLRFKGADGKDTEVLEGYIVSFDEGDKVDIDFLKRVGAILGYEEPVVETKTDTTAVPSESQEDGTVAKEGGKRRGRSTR